MEFHLSWHFYFNSNTAVLIGRKSSSISDIKDTGCFDLDFEPFSVDLGHSFYLFELYGITIVQAVSFLLVEIDGSSLLLGNSCDVD